MSTTSGSRCWGSRVGLGGEGCIAEGENEKGDNLLELFGAKEERRVCGLFSVLLQTARRLMPIQR